MSTNPWDQDFTPAAISEDVLKNIQDVLAGGEQAVENAVSSVLPGGSVNPTAVTSGTVPQSQIPGLSNAITTDLAKTLESVIGAAAKGSTEKALISLAPILEAELAREFQAGTNRVIGQVTGGTGVAPTPNLEDFIKADARSRAFRTLLLGLGVAVLTGLGTAASALSGVDWLTRDGQVAAAGIAVSSVISAVGAYFGRLLSEPQVTKPLTAQLPSKASTP